MHELRRYVGLIPARGGSKAIPNKALATLAGKPLLDYTVEAALRAERIGEVLVSTEDEAIAGRARRLGAGLLMRPAHLATDHVSMDPVILHAIARLDGETDPETDRELWIVLLQPTSPLRTGEDIDAAVEHLERTSARGLVSVQEMDGEAYKYMTVDSEGFLRGMVSPGAPFMRRQDCPPVVHPNGAIYIYQGELFRRAAGFYFEGVVPFVMPPDRSLQVDEPQDLARIEKCLAP